MIWFLFWTIVGVVIGAAWRFDLARMRKQSGRPVNHDTSRDNDNSDDCFADAKSYRRPAAAAGGGGGFFSDCGTLCR